MSGSTTKRVLPFPRGSTFKDGSTLAMISGSTDLKKGDNILGRTFETTDANGFDLVLLAVRAPVGGLTNIGGRSYSYTAGKEGTHVVSLCAADGAVCSVADDAYAATFDVDPFDIFWVVYEGFVTPYAESGVNAASLIIQGNSGGTVEVAVAGSFVLGESCEAVSATTAGRAKIKVSSGLKPSDPATA